MKIELVNTGSELMLGFVTNTNQQWLCRELARLGYLVSRQVAVADEATVIQQAVREALSRASIVITTGGLGPTSDDLTRECIAELAGKPLHEDLSVRTQIEQFFRERKRPMPEKVRVQALVPEGALVLPNRNGTAPGLALEIIDPIAPVGGVPKLLIMLPGPPRELEPMFLNEVVPLLHKKLPSDAPFVCRVLKSTGMGESAVEAVIGEKLAPLVTAGLQLGYCARFGEVDVRLAARGSCAEALVRDAEQIVHSAIGKYVFGRDSDNLESVLVTTLARRQETLALAESCTGGYIANRLTNIPGASNMFLGGFVTYSNTAKETCLGVRPETLAQFGAVSEPVAREMAEGARARMEATYALAVTGIAGPGGGTPDKPVGTVYIALAGPQPTRVLHQVNRYDRESFKFVTSEQTLDLLRRTLPD